MSLQTTTVKRKIVRHGGPYTKVRMVFAEQGRTKQSFQDECNINLIIAKYVKTGNIAHVNKHGAEYGFATSQDFAAAMRTVTIAQEMFDGLPSAIRNRFANNPAAFLDFVQDADNKDEGQKLGLWPKDPETSTEAIRETLPEQPPEEKTEKTEPDPKKE